MAAQKKEPRREAGGALAYLEKQLENIRQQRDAARNLYHQAVGAEAALVDAVEHMKTETQELHERQQSDGQTA